MKALLAVVVLFVASEAVGQYQMPQFSYPPTYAQRKRAQNDAIRNQRAADAQAQATLRAEQDMMARDPIGYNNMIIQMQQRNALRQMQTQQADFMRYPSTWNQPYWNNSPWPNSR